MIALILRPKEGDPSTAPRHASGLRDARIGGLSAPGINSQLSQTVVFALYTTLGGNATEG
jgi:hypothetical protein